ncbi:hypothetical protein [Spirosoma sp. KNUC1025]|uniref:hypothetical protein n=1 Tax=Spirosoma sp. KNUC1025 TaxID=2894082 RepID=UPI00386F5C3A|nr:hypothetical protein LN737_14495 [Spirosoma sp. KNUC1025]
MKDEKEDRFRRLIQKVGPDKPGADFTDAIMKRVQAESEMDLAREATLIQLFQSHPLVEKPSAAFSRRVMNQIVVSQPKPFEPIIRPGVWYMVAASLLIIILSCVFLFPSGAVHHAPSGLDRFLFSIERTLDALPLSYPLTLFAVSGLMALDYFLRRNLKVNY